MDKNILKIIIDIIKNIDDGRHPALKGARLYGHSHEGEKSYLYACDGYRLLRLECGGEKCMPFNDDIFIPLATLQAAYKNMKKGDVYMLTGEKLTAGDDGLFRWLSDSEGWDTPDYNAMYKDLEGYGPAGSEASIDFKMLKDLAPLDRAKMFIFYTGHMKGLHVSAPGLDYIQLGLKDN